MDISPAATLLAAAAPRRERTPREPRLLLPAFALVTGFWWLATGVVIAAQRDGPTRAASLAAASVGAVAGLWLIHATRSGSTPGAARRSMVGGSLLWLWVATTFYGGWIVGPAPAPLAPGASRIDAAGAALHALAWHEAASIAVVLATALLSRGAANRAGRDALIAFWGTQQLAKVNVLLGVANPGAGYLPEWLRFLQMYFGPPANSPLLALSVVGLMAGAAWLAVRAVRSTAAPRRASAAMVAWIVALAALEHAFLAITWHAPLWDVFLRLRG
jgi:putative photosynthetic complex assembly protein 2